MDVLFFENKPYFRDHLQGEISGKIEDSQKESGLLNLDFVEIFKDISDPKDKASSDLENPDLASPDINRDYSQSRESLDFLLLDSRDLTSKTPEFSEKKKKKID